jgi:hypothetical protein
VRLGGGLAADRVAVGAAPGVLNRVLFEAGIFVIRDNEQGKRYGRRGPDGRIIEAYGFDLSPLAQRYDEFVQGARLNRRATETRGHEQTTNWQPRARQRGTALA